MIYYKLTDENDRTRGGTQWGENVSHSGTGEGELCSPGWIHAYTHPLLAVLLNPIHASFVNPHLWECEGSGAIKTDHGLKIGMQHCRTIRRIETPVVSLEQRIQFVILCALTVYDEPWFAAWANAWLSGSDRSQSSANKAWEAAEAAAARAAAAAAAARAAAAAAAWAAEAWAAEAAAEAAAAAARAAAAAAAWAEEAAAEAAAIIAAAGPSIDLIALAIEATK